MSLLDLFQSAVLTELLNKVQYASLCQKHGLLTFQDGRYRYTERAFRVATHLDSVGQTDGHAASFINLRMAV